MTATINLNAAFDMSTFTGFRTGAALVHTPTLYRIEVAGGYVLEFIGTGFEYTITDDFNPNLSTELATQINVYADNTLTTVAATFDFSPSPFSVTNGGYANGYASLLNAIAQTNNFLVTGSVGADVLAQSGAVGDVLTGGGGNDVFALNASLGLTGVFAINGANADGSGMGVGEFNTLRLATGLTFDGRGGTYTNINRIEFGNSGDFNLTSDQLGTGSIALDTVVTGSAGTDTVLLYNTSANLDLSGLTFVNFATGQDYVLIDNLVAAGTALNMTLSAADDQFFAINHTASVSVSGGGGNDSIGGGSGADVLDGGAGSDLLNGGVGDDTLILGGGADTAFGAQGDDTFIIRAGFTAVGTTINGWALKGFEPGGSNDIIRLEANADFRGALISQIEIVDFQGFTGTFNQQQLASLAGVLFTTSDGGGVLATVGTVNLGALAI